MPRLARLDAPGVLHHVMIRGIERRNIFNDNKDRDNLLSRLEELIPATQTSCYAWSFLSNHAHFLFRTGTTGLSTLMKRTNPMQEPFIVIGRSKNSDMPKESWPKNWA